MLVRILSIGSNFIHQFIALRSSLSAIQVHNKITLKTIAVAMLTFAGMAFISHAKKFEFTYTLLGSLMSISLVIGALSYCYFGGYPHSITKPTKGISTSSHDDLIGKLPDEIMMNILSYLQLTDLRASCRVSKNWNRLANDVDLWKKAIFHEIAFSNENWAQKLGEDSVKNEDRKEELSSMPLEDIVKTFRKYKLAFPEKKVVNDLMLVRLPKTLNGNINLNNVGDILKNYFPENLSGYEYIWPQIVTNIGNTTIDKSRWVVMLKDGIQAKKGMTKEERAFDFSEETQIPWEVSETLETITCALAEYLRTGKWPFPYRETTGEWPYYKDTYISCKERIDGWGVVASFGSGSPKIRDDVFGYDVTRVAVLQKF